MVAKSMSLRHTYAVVLCGSTITSQMEHQLELKHCLLSIYKCPLAPQLALTRALR